MKINSIFVYFFIVIVSFLSVFYILRNGNLLTNDSIDFYDLAYNFRNSAELRHRDGSLLTVRPPLFSIVLSMIAQTKTIQENVLIRFFPYLILGLNLFLFYKLVHLVFDNEWIRLFLFASFSWASGIILCTVYLWSENLFIDLGI